MTNKYPVYLGFSPAEMEATNVAEASLRSVSGSRVDIRRISRLSLHNVYTRPTEMRETGLWDVISDAPMSTDHAIARFFIPYLREYSGWALFSDGDVIFRRDVCELFEMRDEKYAVMVVQHPAASMPNPGLKKLGAIQTAYPRKNWSSVMLINCGHPANRMLSLEYVNSRRGRDLHGFQWLRDSEIGALPARWNYLVGLTEPRPFDPAIVHFTLGVPTTPGHAHDDYATEWWYWSRVAGYEFVRPSPGVPITSGEIGVVEADAATTEDHAAAAGG